MGSRILIIDDDIVSSKTFKQVLEREGHIVTTSHDGLNLLDIIYANGIDIVLLEITLPGVSGYDLMRLLQTTDDTREIPVICLTGITSAENIKKALDLGAMDYIHKPCEAIELIARVNSAMRLKHKQDLLNEFAQRDGLTKLYNRRYFNVMLDYVMSRKEDYVNGVALLILDCDHFKIVNDMFGHSIGDRVLATIANVLGKSVKRSDFACRFGGDEFCLIMPDTTAEQSLMVAERIHLNVQHIPFSADEKMFTATVSGGISHTTANDGKDAAFLINEADAALYDAKSSGRNIIKMFNNSGTGSIKYIF